MVGQKNPEVLVIGAGPVGLFSALELTKRNVNVIIVDQERRPAAHSYALALHPASLELFDELGLIDGILDQARRIDRVGIYEGMNRRAELRLSDLEVKYPFLAVMPQNVLEGLLEEELGRQSVKVQWNHEAVVIRPRDTHIEVAIDRLEKESMGYPIAKTEWVVAKTNEYEIPFAIGADGYLSDVRRVADIKFEEIAEAQYYAIYEFETDATVRNEMRVVLNERNCNVFWPIKEGYCRWSFELEDFEIPPVSRAKDRFVVQLGDAAFPVLAAEELRPLLTERAPWFEGSIDEIHWRISVRFERRLASAFGRNRLWLVGDAGHMTGPVGVQSMNVGFREARDLASVIAEVLKRGASPERIEDYNRERLEEWRFLLGMQGGLKSTENTDPWIKKNASRLVPCIPASGETLLDLVRQIGLTK